MVKTMKRSLSMLLALLMLLCVFPVSTFAADDKCTITVGKDRAAVREEPNQDGAVIERPKKGKSLTCTSFVINSKLNLWYEVKCSDGSTGYIYSGNVKKVSNATKADARVEMSRDLLNKQTCREQAKKLVATGHKEGQMKREIYAHAVAYYLGLALELTEDMICALFPDKCVSHQEAVDFVNQKVAQELKEHADPVNIGGSSTLWGIKVEEWALNLIYTWIWLKY